MKLSKTFLILGAVTCPMAWLVSVSVGLINPVSMHRTSAFVVSLVAWLPLVLIIAGFELKRRNR